MSTASAVVPVGYKQTEVGVIPEDWKYCLIKDLVQQKVIEKPMDGNHGNIHPKSSDYVYYGVPFVMANNIQNGKVDLQNCSFISKQQGDNLDKGFSKEGDVLLTHKATIGNVAIVPQTEHEYIMLTPQVTYYRVINHFVLNNHYLRFFFESGLFQNVIKNMSGGGTRSYIGITSQLNLPLVIPSLTEQRIVVEKLYNISSFIDSLELMISKKQDIKQSTMQELLTGKTRLPGFTGKWDVKSIGQVGEISGSGVDKKIIEGEIPVRLVNYLDVYNRSFIYSTELDHYVTAPPSKAIKCSVRKGDVFFTPTSEVRDDIAVSAVAMEDIPDGVHSYHVVRLRIRDDWDLNFRAYAFQTKSFLDQAAVLADGSGTRYVISLPNFRKLKVLVPSKLEQQAIGQILSDMDAEIAALEERLEKAKAIKQGMMQQLLTGKIRLVEPQTSQEVSA